jgi:hypothetical protein
MDVTKVPVKHEAATILLTGEEIINLATIAGRYYDTMPNVDDRKSQEFRTREMAYQVWYRLKHGRPDPQ